MQTSRFQLGLVATLAVGLGFSLSSSQAIGYPAGAAVSYGANPILSVGGRVAGFSGHAEPISAPADHILVLTDVVLTGAATSYDCRGQILVELSRSDTGATIGQFTLDVRTHNYSTTGVVDSHFSSGIAIPPGVALEIDTSLNYRVCDETLYHVDYTLSGYYAQP